jgi:hypothetical protein
MLVRPPCSELRQVGEDPFSVRVEDMRAIPMYEQPAVVVTVIGVTADVRTAINDEHRLVRLRGQALRQDTPCKTSSYNEIVEHCGYPFRLTLRVSCRGAGRELRVRCISSHDRRNSDWCRCGHPPHDDVVYEYSHLLPCAVP